MNRSSARARRNQQILFLILSVLVVASMALSLFTLTPQPVQPTLPPVTATWPATAPGLPAATAVPPTPTATTVPPTPTAQVQ